MSESNETFTKKRMICKPGHVHRNKTCKVGEIIEDTPHYIRLLESQNVTVPVGYEDLFSGALQDADGDYITAMAVVVEQQAKDEAAKLAAEQNQPEQAPETVDPETE